MKARFKNYFTFSKSERIGIIILISAIIVLILLPHVVRQNMEISPMNKDDDLYKVEIETFMQSAQEKRLQARNSWYDDLKGIQGKRGVGKSRFTPFPFDPNTASKEVWVKMGFSERQADVIIKYRDRGGHFNRKEDFSKLYVVDEETYSIFEPYIVLSDSSLGKTATGKRNDISLKKDYSSSNNKEYRNEGLNIELNGADSLELLRINGVGPVFASRIMKYRQRLGGFTSLGQLREVYGIDSARFSGIVGQISADTSLIKGIDFNKASLAELRKHPYLDYYSAKAIIDRRVQLEGFTTYKEIEAVLAGKPGLYRRLRPYIKLHR